jgi:hypothetical protein
MAMLGATTLSIEISWHVHLPGRVKREQPRLVDLHARLRHPVLDELFLGQRATEGHAVVRVAAH